MKKLLLILALCPGVLFPSNHFLKGNDYKIQATLLPAENQLSGNVQVKFVNTSDNDLSFIAVRCSGTINDCKTIKGKPLPFVWDENLNFYKVNLAKLLAPGSNFEFKASFSGPYTEGEFMYHMTNRNWHPQCVALFNNKFDILQEQADTYNVDIIIPENEIVVASGKEINKEKMPDGKVKYSFAANNIVNFGLASSLKFIKKTHLSDSISINSFYFQEQSDWGELYSDYAREVVGFYKELFGFYPQTFLNIIPGSFNSQGGFPYASGILAIHRNIEQGDTAFVKWIISHEIGHEYWGYGCVLNDRNYQHWPGLALGIYSDRLYCEKYNPNGLKSHTNFYEMFMRGVYNKLNMIILTENSRIDDMDFDFNNYVAHSKSFVVICMLENLLGKENFMRLLKNLLNGYQNKILTDSDFRKECENVYNNNLDWFFNDWVYKNTILNFSIDTVIQTAGKISIKIDRLGDGRYPMPIRLFFNDRTTLDEILDMNKLSQWIEVKTIKKLEKVIIDPEGILPDFSEDGSFLWGKKASIKNIILTENTMKWGSNEAKIVIENSDALPHDIELNVMVKNGFSNRGWGKTHNFTVSPEKSDTFNIPFVCPSFPGKTSLSWRIKDLMANNYIFYNKLSFDYPYRNNLINPLHVYDRDFTNAKKSIYPRLIMFESGHFVCYYLEDDTLVKQNIQTIVAERERAYTKISERINPGFNDTIIFYLFHDDDSKFQYVFHQGKGMAFKTIIAEVYNEKDKLDIYHELTHVISEPLGYPPALFNEGLAVYFQDREEWNNYHVDTWTKAFKENGLLIPVSQLFLFSEIGTEESKPGIAYPEAGSFIKYISEQYGFSDVMKAFQKLKNTGEPLENLKVFIEIFDKDIELIEKEWLRYLDAAVPKVPLPGSELEKFKK